MVTASLVSGVALSSSLIVTETDTVWLICRTIATDMDRVATSQDDGIQVERYRGQSYLGVVRELERYKFDALPFIYS